MQYLFDLCRPDRHRVLKACTVLSSGAAAASRPSQRQSRRARIAGGREGCSYGVRAASPLSVSSCRRAHARSAVSDGANLRVRGRREFIEATQALESEKQQFVAEATQARAELEQSSADRRELAGQLRALLEEKGRWDQERPRLEGSLAHERDGKEHFQQRVREQVELRLGVLQARVEELASRDTLLLGKLADAANQVGHARAAVEAETARRRDAEATLREATDLFKRELWEKQEELRGLATQLHQLRDWHGRFVEALGHDVRATARILSQVSRDASAATAPSWGESPYTIERGAETDGPSPCVPTPAQPVAEAAYVQPRPTQPHHFSQPPATFSSSELSSQPEPSLQSRFAEAYRVSAYKSFSDCTTVRIAVCSVSRPIPALKFFPSPSPGCGAEAAVGRLRAILRSSSVGHDGCQALRRRCASESGALVPCVLHC